MRIDHKDIIKINYWISKFYEDIIKVVDQIEACIKILEHKVHEGIHLSCQKKVL
jgi:molecular chaperone GrpE (heat shock protein)